MEPETRPLWNDAQDEVLGIDSSWHTNNKATIWRWRTAYQNDFVARMNWTIKPYKEANHPPVPRLDPVKFQPIVIALLKCRPIMKEMTDPF